MPGASAGFCLSDGGEEYIMRHSTTQTNTSDTEMEQVEAPLESSGETIACPVNFQCMAHKGTSAEESQATSGATSEGQSMSANADVGICTNHEARTARLGPSHENATESPQRRTNSPQEANADISTKESGAHEARDRQSQQTTRRATSTGLEDSVTKRGESTQCTSAPAAAAHPLCDVEKGLSQQ